MLLKGLSDRQLRLLRKALESDDEADSYYRELKRGAAKVYFSIDEEALSIRYEASTDSRFVAIIVNVAREIEDAFAPSTKLSKGTLGGFPSALALYLYESESASSEDVLRQRYGHFYALFAKFSQFSPSQIATYLEQKSQLLGLINELDREHDVLPSIEQSDVTASIELELEQEGNAYADYFTVQFFIKASNKRKAIRILELEDLAVGRSSFAVSSSKADPIVVSLNNFSSEDRAILSYLPALSSASDRGYNRSSRVLLISRDYSSLVTLLNYFKGREIIFHGVPFRVEEEVSTIKMFIDESGSISPSIDTDPNDLFIQGDQLSAYFSSNNHTVMLLRFTSKKAKILYQFYQSHPDFKYDLFAEEIGGTLLPKVSSDTIVDKDFEEKTKVYRTAIKYYVTYNDDLTLTMNTIYSVRGAEVDRDTFIDEGSQNTYEAFKKELDRLGLEEEGVYHDAEEIAPILEGDFSRLSRLCSLYLSDNLASKKVHKSMPIKVNAESGIDWFELSFQSDTLTEKQINDVLKAYAKKKKYIRIGDDYYSLDNEELATLAKRFNPEEGLTTKKLPLYQALHLNHDGKSQVTLSKQLIELFRELNDYPSLNLPLKKHLSSALRPYQLDGVRWMTSLARHGLAGILADDMGLGKSLELISFLSLLEEEGPTLIISPKSLIYNWESEFHKWDPSRQVFVLGANKAGRVSVLESAKDVSKPVLIVSYDSLRNDIEAFEKYQFTAVILDEGQYIANAFALKSKAVKTLKAKYRFVLTGTPIQNSFLDLWSIFDFLMPGYLDDYNEFQNIYRGYESVHSEEGKKLEKMVAPFLLRRKKTDVLQDLPPKTEEVVRIQFGEQEQTLYSSYLANVKNELRKDVNKSNKIAMLAMLTRLRQLCVDPSSFLEYNDVSTKLSYVVDMAKEAISGGHKILIFSTFAETLLHLEKLLDDERIAHHLIYGQTSAAKRLSYAEDFNNNPNVSVMLVSLKAGGTGLNLIGADIVIHLDPWWNIAAEEQATDRAHRIGQTRSVSVYKLIMVDTVEEKVIELQQKKKELTNILHSEGEVGASLTADDIYYLLS